MNLGYETVYTILFIVIILFFLYKYIGQKKERKKAQELWKTGATKLLVRVWGLDRILAKPKFFNAAVRNKKFIHAWMARCIKKELEITHDVCGETVKVYIQHPNKVFAFVEKEETERAIREAYKAMYSREQELCVGLCPLVLDIRVTG